MKTIVGMLPKPGDLITFWDGRKDILTSSEISELEFIEEPETFYYFRDNIFIEEVAEFLRKKYNIKLNYKKDDYKQLNGATKVNRFYEDQETIHGHYKEYNKTRNKYYLYNNGIYSFDYLGFDNVGNEIQVYKYNENDLITICNSLHNYYRKPLIDKLIIKIKSIIFK